MGCKIEAEARLLPYELVSMLAKSVGGEIEEITCNGTSSSTALENLKFESSGWKQ